MGLRVTSLPSNSATRLMPGKAFEIGRGSAQFAFRFAPAVDDSPSVRHKRQHHQQAHAHAQPRDDSKVTNDADWREQTRQKGSRSW